MFVTLHVMTLSVVFLVYILIFSNFMLSLCSVTCIFWDLCLYTLYVALPYILLYTYCLYCLHCIIIYYTYCTYCNLLQRGNKDWMNEWMKTWVSLRRFLAMSDTKSQSCPWCTVLAHLVQMNFSQVLHKQASSSWPCSSQVLIASWALYKRVAILIYIHVFFLFTLNL